MNIFRCVKFLPFILIFISAEVAGVSKKNDDKTFPPSFLSVDSSWVDSVFNSLSAEQRVAQLIMAAVYPNKDSVHYKQMTELIARYNLGGIIVFQGGPVKTALYINKLQAKAQTPLIVGIDGEWGLSMRMDSTISYPKQIMLGAIADDKLIYQMGEDISMQLKRMGMHTNFSPVADINNNAANPVINTRSFGENRNLVLAKSFAYMAGLQDNRILATAKHFPGHGDTETDSHVDLPILPYPVSRLDSVELYPFKQLINSGLSGIMVAHLNVPALDSSGVPATMSKKIIDSLLIKKLGFQGLVFTDALNMKGISKRASPRMIAIESFLAGVDILLMPDDIKSVIEGLQTAVQTGVISQNEVNRRCKKVLMAKFWLQLNHYKPIDTTNLFQDLHKPEYEMNLRRLVEAGITVVRNEKNLLPLTQPDTCRIACISVGYADTTVFQKYCQMYWPVDLFSIDRNANDSAYNELFAKLKNYKLVLAGLVNTDMRYTRRFGISDVSVNFLQRLADTTQVVLNLFANPYSLQRFRDVNKFKSIVVSFEDKPINQELTAQLLFGGTTSEGNLPVKACDSVHYGTGIHLHKQIRLKYTIPEELGIDRESLQSIDSLVNDAIVKQAIPGCVVYCAKDGKVFINKAYGHFTYDSVRSVKNTDIYDIASVTKMAATTTALMHLYDENKLNLSKNLRSYIHMPRSSNKAKIILKDVLAHQARLKPFIPIQLNTLECIDPFQNLVSKKPAANSVKVGEGMYINCESKYKAGVFQKNYTENYPNKVCDSLFIHKSWRDTIYNAILASELLQTNAYKYSDLGFILMPILIEKQSGKAFNVLIDSILYKPLGASTLCFNPLQKHSRDSIAPTEYDKTFRKQQIQGYVHDPTAAMLGGISGHAGLFSSANDLGKLMQVFLNKGEYGGRRYFKSETIDLFTAQAFPETGNRRGLGFDKPEPDTTKESPVSRYCSNASFGHSGFTGAMVWADPSEQLVFVFLSNRVYPDASVNKLAALNLRTNIQDVIYKALLERKANAFEKILIFDKTYK